MRCLRQIGYGCVLLLCMTAVFAASSPFSNIKNIQQATRSAKQQLKNDHKYLRDSRSEVAQLQVIKKKQLQRFVVAGIQHKDLAHVALLVANARADVGNIDIALADANEHINFIQNSLSEIKSRSRIVAFTTESRGKKTLAELAEQRAALYSLQDLQYKRVNVLRAAKENAQKRLLALQAWQQQLHKLYQMQIREGDNQDYMAVAQQLQQRQQSIIAKLSQLNTQLEAITEVDTPSLQKRSALQFQIFVLQEKVAINRSKIFLMQLHSRLQPLMIIGPETDSLVDLQEQRINAQKILRELLGMRKVVQDKIKLIKSHQDILLKNHKAKILSDSIYNSRAKILQNLLRSYQRQAVQVSSFQEQVLNYQEQVRQFIRQQFKIRQSLPGFDIHSWLDLTHNVLTVPVLMWRSLQDLVVQLYYQLKELSTWTLYAITLIGIVLVMAWALLRKSFMRLLQALEETSRRFTSQLLTVLIRLIRRNLGTMMIIAIISSLMIMFDLDATLWLSIVIVYLVYRIAVLLARFWILEAVSDEEGKDVNLYRGLRWVFASAAILTVLTILAHALPVAYEVRVLFNKAFMLLLLILSVLLLRAWSILPDLFQRAFALRRKYILKVIRLITWVLPFTLLSNAIIGLIGYVDLAWTIGKYQAIALLVLTIYMIARGLLIDFMELNYELLIRHFKAGWLWAQAFIRPLDRVLRGLLFLAAILLLIYLCGLDENATFIAYVEKLFTMTLLTIFGNKVTLLGLAGLFIFIAVLSWAVKWSREFAFRWLYNKSKDVGVRHSLAVVTQYFLVVVGIIIGLRIFGIDLRGLAVVAAAFAAAAGFGMRDVVSNFFSGLMLLGERPFRNGDTISLGQYEGEVVGSGMRSLKIRTWDRMEVIVPNSDMFTKPFVNWTHQDSIVRSVLKINISRSDDPHRVQEIILGLLVNLPGVSDDPHCEVFMKEISEAVTEIEVRYFINLQIEKSRSRVRSEVLFEIWDAFKENGIKAPYPVYDVNIQKES